MVFGVIPSLSYDPSEDRSKNKIFSDTIVIESRFSVLLNAEWLGDRFLQMQSALTAFEILRAKHINCYILVFQFNQMAYNVLLNGALTISH